MTSNTDALIGTWQLLRTASRAADGSQLPAPYGGGSAMGLVTFSADGRMICVLCDGRAQVPADTAREYNSYCGAFTFDGTKLVTTVDASSNADWFATDQVRDVSFEGDTLVLRPPLRAYAAQSEQRVLYWRKIE